MGLPALAELHTLRGSVGAVQVFVECIDPQERCRREVHRAWQRPKSEPQQRSVA